MAMHQLQQQMDYGNMQQNERSSPFVLMTLV